MGVWGRYSSEEMALRGLRFQGADAEERGWVMEQRPDPEKWPDKPWVVAFEPERIHPPLSTESEDPW